jgi:hypothetical protein
MLNRPCVAHGDTVHLFCPSSFFGPKVGFGRLVRYSARNEYARALGLKAELTAKERCRVS